MRASSVEWVTAVISGRSMVSSSPTTKVPGSSLKLDRQWMRTPWVRAYSTERSCSTRAPEAAISSISSKLTTRELAGVGDDPRVGAEHAGDVGVDLAHLGVHGGGERDGGGVGAAAAERGDVLGGARRPGSRRRARSGPRRRPGGCGRRGRRGCAPWCGEVSVTMPACEPVSEIALWPRSLIAIAHSAQLIRSPVESSMSISRGSGVGRDLLGHRDQLVGHRAARGQHGHDVVALLAGADDPAGGALEALGVGDRGAAELHDDGAGHDGSSSGAGERAAERDLVGVLEVAADRQAGGEAGDRDVGRALAQAVGDVQRGRLAGGGRVGGEHDLADLAGRRRARRAGRS